MHTYARSDRVSHQIQREVSELLLRRVKDPRVGLVTITRVQVTPDLKHAKIYFSTPYEQNADEAKRGLESATGFIRSELGRRLIVKKIPELEFLPDDQYERALSVSDTIERLEKERKREQGDE